MNDGGVQLGATFEDVLDGPVWDGAGVLFCSVRRSEIHRWDPVASTSTLVRCATVRARSLAFGPDGSLYAAQSRARRVMLLADDGGSYYLEAMLEGERHNDPQDVVVDRAGRIWFTDRYTDDSIPGPVGYPPLGHQSVLRLDRVDGPTARRAGRWQLARMTFDTRAPFGLAFSPDETTLYVTDGIGTADEPSRLVSYAAASGPLPPGRTIHEWPVGIQARGIAVEPSGTVLAASASGDAGSLDMIDPGGGIVRSLALSDAPTNCCVTPLGVVVTTESGRLLRVTD